MGGIWFPGVHAVCVLGGGVSHYANQLSISDLRKEG